MELKRQFFEKEKLATKECDRGAEQGVGQLEKAARGGRGR